MDFSLHSYFSILYIIAFLPIVLVAYQVVAQRLRWAVLLVASYAFFWAISSKLIVFILISTVSVYLAGRKMGALFSERDALIAQDKTRKKELKKLYQKKARLVCGLGVGFNLLLLACLKYLVFFGEVAGSLLALLGLNVPVAVPYIGVPIGISFYTLMAASYLFDIYRGTIAPDTNLGRIALFLSFFPQIMEGPICRYGQTAEQLWAGTPINKDNLYRGSVRILWGFAKKMIVADRLNMVVKPIFADYTSYDGGVVAAAAVLYTLQLYCDFSGCMDVALGTARIFGIALPENFRHPFFSRTASEFWQRWHITLGSWLRDYIFYPLSLSTPMKSLTKAARHRIGNRYGPLLAGSVTLFCVWFANGLWHGAGSQYIFFGLYYFVIILLGGLVEPLAQSVCAKLHINREGTAWRTFQWLRTLVVVFVGELFFRAEGMDAGLYMFGQLVGNFTLESFTNGAFMAIGLTFPSVTTEVVGLCLQDYAAVAAMVVVMTIVAIVEERGCCITERLAHKNLAVRWVVLYALIIAIVIFGSYGVGTAPLDPIYAQF